MNERPLQYQTVQELVDSANRIAHVNELTNLTSILEYVKSKVEQLENQKKHFQGLSLRVFQFLDEHYPDAPGEFDIIENGGELE
tara:strand:- start:423 stop:674 length:252 start_codon:yes stop_codon:yes gene_type:complete